MLEFHIQTTANHVDGLSDQLSLLGADAVTWKDAADQPIYEPKPGEIIHWPSVTLIALFADESLEAGISDYLRNLQSEALLSSFKRVDVPEEDWIRASLDQFKPACFGKRLWICPSWATPPAPDAVNVLLDPGLAFGTGTHPTTALCLRWLDEHILGGETVMDYGCGSGIIAVAALKLGASLAIGVDYDPQAVDACQMNAKLNALSPEQLMVYTPESMPAIYVDVLIANILAKTLIELASELVKCVKSEGHIVLSGILPDQADDVLKVYAEWFEMDAIVIENDWVRLSGRRKKVA